MYYNWRFEFFVNLNTIYTLSATRVNIINSSVQRNRERIRRLKIREKFNVIFDVYFPYNTFHNG